MMTHVNPSGTARGSPPAERIRATMAAVRLSFTWLGVRKTLTRAQKAQAAEAFGAEQKYLSAGKKLLDTSHPAFKAVTAIKGRTIAYWKGMSLPYPEPGIRLIRQCSIQAFDSRMLEFKSELQTAVEQLQSRFAELRQRAQERLGDLYALSDYPSELLGQFLIEHDFPSVEPPDYLQQLNPELYAQECRRMQSRFEEAARLAEEAFLTEFSELVSHLCERLSGDEDGKPKVFRDAAVVNLQAFFGRFRELNVGSSEELEQLVLQAQRVVGRVSPHAVRSKDAVRTRMATQLSGVQSVLDGLLVDRPRRRILRGQA
ncbi:hypothetical protein SH661x_002877 [Planctomicrobium sp. SH661]|uniref:hypothetical protein n=1 Tax=Planctomicrobium sp. SH661 TaxID=3448124 RepID=UPI003F5C63F3